ncbi:MAG: NADH-quinone oxidoreductase subunit C [Candidatus Vogelbacteria bacterium]|nr:NADH-quinone oxidoreductase subunit C [Candidatus Vogelbacteria bacterium]
MENSLIEKLLAPGASLKIFGDLKTFEIEAENLVEICRLISAEGYSLKTLTAFDERSDAGRFKVMYVFGQPGKDFLAPYIMTAGDFPSITPLLHDASIYERKIYTLFGLTPVGHPDLRTLILHENWPEGVYPLRKDFNWNDRPKEAHTLFHFRKVTGEGVYEVPVGPVHAGIIEPGHFRFSLAGEEILMLEPRLGYSHKGTEKLFEVLPLADKVKLSERISGDSSFSHSLAFCQTVEKLANIPVPKRATYLRTIFAELERLANHFGDIGAIMIDTGFNFGGAHGARLREQVIRWNDKLSGSRFLRGLNTIGGLQKDISTENANALNSDLNDIEKDFKEVLAVAMGSSTLANRLHKTGKLTVQVAKDHGVLGVPARAAGMKIDTRIDFPYAAYADLPLEISTETDGDVWARFQVRVKEVHTTIKLLKEALSTLPEGSVLTENAENPVFPAGSLSLGLVEGWRGEILYLISTDQDGQITRVAPRDPSFMNWTAAGHAGPGNILPDFPLINKSLNLSYSGNDL